MRPSLLSVALLVAPALPTHAQDCTPVPLADLQLVVSPTLAQVGQPVELTLTNLSTECTYTLPSTCLFTKVSSEDCEGDDAFFPPCGGASQSLLPGASVSATWDQTTQGGLQVPEGLWAFTVPVSASDGQVGKLCALVQVGTSCASPFAYGVGTTGTGGNVPSLSTLGGPPSLGNADFQVAVTNGVGGSTAIALVSLAQAAIQLDAGTLLVDPVLLFLVDPFALSGASGAPGQGIGFLPLPIPDAPGLVGLELFFQAAVVDLAASGGFALTQGVHAAVCP